VPTTQGRKTRNPGPVFFTNNYTVTFAGSSNYFASTAKGKVG
jgi:hypothetical protein